MKERLIGAVVLVLAAVIIIPVLLDGPETDSTEKHELALPVPASETVRTHTVDLKAGDAATERADPAPIAPQNDEVADAWPAVSTEKPAVAQTRVEDSATTALPPAKPAAKSAEAQPAAPTGDGWAVQVGSFTSENNARRLAALLKSSDYPAFVTRNVINGRVVFRVRVGPEPDRARAEALAERLRFDRQQTQLVRHP